MDKAKVNWGKFLSDATTFCTSGNTKKIAEHKSLKTDAIHL
jgi:hypothetical protein